MPWHEITLVEPIWRLLGATAEPTNPSSFVLAFVGVGTFLCYQLLARPGHGSRRPVDLGQVIAKPQAAVIAVEDATEDRRVA